MPLDLFAGIPVTDYAAALAWYERLFGSPPSFIPTDTEAVWELAEHRFVFIEQRPEHAGHARHLVFVDDLDALVAQITERDSPPRSGKPTRTASARPRTTTPTATNSGSAAPQCRRWPPRWVKLPRRGPCSLGSGCSGRGGRLGGIPFPRVDEAGAIVQNPQRS